jgi:hypothetical protein
VRAGEQLTDWADRRSAWWAPWGSNPQPAD